MENAKTMEYKQELMAAMTILQATASNLLEHIVDPKVP